MLGEEVVGGRRGGLRLRGLGLHHGGLQAAGAEQQQQQRGHQRLHLGGARGLRGRVSGAAHPTAPLSPPATQHLPAPPIPVPSLPQPPHPAPSHPIPPHGTSLHLPPHPCPTALPSRSHPIPTPRPLPTPAQPHSSPGTILPRSRPIPPCGTPVPLLPHPCRTAPSCPGAGCRLLLTWAGLWGCGAAGAPSGAAYIPQASSRPWARGAVPAPATAWVNMVGVRVAVGGGPSLSSPGVALHPRPLSLCPQCPMATGRTWAVCDNGPGVGAVGGPGG